VTNGQFLSSVGDGTFLPGTIDNIGGTISGTADSKIGFIPGVMGSGTLAIFQFTAIGNGTIPIGFQTDSVILLDSNLNDIPFTGAGMANVNGTSAVPEPRAIGLLGLVLFGLASLHPRLRKTLKGS
jgi:hypothetical protein